MIKKNIVLAQLKGLEKTKQLIKMEEVLQQYLQEYPQDTEMWLKLCMLEDTPPLADAPMIMFCVKKILDYDPHNIYALLCALYVYHYKRPIIDSDIIHKLFTVKSSDNELMSMLELAKAWYYQDNNEMDLAKTALLKSIDYCGSHVNNHEELALLYLQEQQFEEAYAELKTAIQNVIELWFIDRQSKGLIDITDFIDEWFKGTCLTEENFNSMKKEFEYCKQRLDKEY